MCGSIPNKPDSDWLLAEARKLSAKKDENSVRALAWNINVAFNRWAVVEAEREQQRRAEHDQHMHEMLAQMSKGTPSSA